MMARAPRSCLALLALLALAGGCKVSASTSTNSAADAKPNGPADQSTAKPNPDGDSGGEASTLTAVPAKPVDPEAGEAPDRAATGNTCADAGHEPGDSWKDDCNTCNCTDAGEVVCTRMHCGGDDAPH